MYSWDLFNVFTTYQYFYATQATTTTTFMTKTRQHQIMESNQHITWTLIYIEPQTHILLSYIIRLSSMLDIFFVNSEVKYNFYCSAKSRWFGLIVERESSRKVLPSHVPKSVPWIQSTKMSTWAKKRLYVREKSSFLQVVWHQKQVGQLQRERLWKKKIP